ncbi:ABC transporter substrate-binding protein [Gellertiella hungarica]|uniref:Multiple sugar transport system substrate-binding protein n=1 Tax=Gellertiella hungarica TaxID=1572859 RepID=A0A7W6NJT8_9HYPH|nr:extracellular solute-binding protein [Gellertiella hungarica]MBB4063715.1 multiple sugar transport system substrate-binding protein [Gellertiella hungarica]
MSFKDYDKHKFVVDTCNAFTQKRITKRDFLRKMALAGLGFSAFSSQMLGVGRPVGKMLGFGSGYAEAQTPPDVEKWLKEVGGKYKGTKIRYSTEATPPSIVANQLAKEEFTKLTGIEVEVEIVPLEQVLAKATQDVQGQLGTYDLYYLDQSWMATFAPDTVDPTQYYKDNAELAMPGFDWDDFSKPLVEGIAMYDGKMVGIPFDIPIFIMMYRQDLLDKHGIKVPETMDDYMNAVKAITEAEKGNGIYGTTVQAKSGHYSLECDWTAFLWGNGGSIFNKDKMFSGNDERGIAGLKYYQELVKNAPPAATTWTWDGEGQSVQQGQAALLLSWGEFFPGFDSDASKVKGLMQAAKPPKENPGRRAPSEAGFGEIPAIGHQGGSVIALSQYSKNKEAAWIFMQWACSKDVMARVSTLGGGASPMRLSSFSDPRVKEKAVVGPGTTRHFDVVNWTINNAMGSEPDMPIWAELSNNDIPIELGKLLTGEAYDGSAEACMNALAKTIDEKVAAAGLR